MMVQSTLHTNRVRLVPLADEHLKHEIELDSDPEVMRYLGAGRQHCVGELFLPLEDTGFSPGEVENLPLSKVGQHFPQVKGQALWPKISRPGSGIGSD